MRAIVTADWHFDTWDRLSTVGADGINSRLRDQMECAEWIGTVGDVQQADTIIIAGDLFDSRTVIDVSVLSAMGTVLSDLRTRFRLIAIPGNHDAYLRTARITGLLALTGLVELVTKPYCIGGVGFVPWDDSPDVMHEYVKACGSKVNYLFSHGLVCGAHAGGEHGMPVDVFDCPAKRVFLGDVHEPVPVDKRIQYVGAPMQHDFRDAGGRRGVLFLDTASGKERYIENDVSPRFHILEGGDSASKVRPTDYVRVVGPLKAAETTVEQVRRVSPTVYVEADVEGPATTTARLDLKPDGDRAEALTQYVEHVETELDRKELVRVGLELLSD